MCLTPQLFSWFIHTQMWDCQVLQPPPSNTSSPPELCFSAPPTSLDECFFFNSLVVGLPYSLIFCQFWLFFVFKFVVVFLLVVQGGTVCLPMPSSWPEVSWLFKMGPGGNVYTMEVGKGLFSFWGAGCQTATSTALPGQWPYFC